MLLTADDIDFKKYLTEPTTAARVQSTTNFRDALHKELYDLSWRERGAFLPWRKFDQVRFPGGQVSMWIGMNGHGKSLMTSFVMQDFMVQNQKVCIASMEMRPADTLKRMLRQATGVATPSASTTDQWLKWADERLFIYDQQGTVDRDEMLAIIRYAATKFGVKHFVIDSLLKCQLAEDDYTAQKKFMDALCVCARDFDVHIHLIHHSRKPADEHSIPGKYDSRGSGTVPDQADHVFIVYRNKKKEFDKRAGKPVDDSLPDAILVVDKNRHLGWEAKIGLWVNTEAGTYHDTPDRIFHHVDIRTPVHV
jgi:twinkle protein